MSLYMHVTVSEHQTDIPSSQCDVHKRSSVEDNSKHGTMQSRATQSPAPAGPVSNLRFDQSSPPQSSPTFLTAMQHVTPYSLLITPRPLLLQLDTLKRLSAPARHSPGTPYPCQTACLPRLPAPSHHSPGIAYTSFTPHLLH